MTESKDEKECVFQGAGKEATREGFTNPRNLVTTKRAKQLEISPKFKIVSFSLCLYFSIISDKELCGRNTLLEGDGEKVVPEVYPGEQLLLNVKN